MDFLSKIGEQLGGIALVIAVIVVLLMMVQFVRVALRLYRKVGPNTALVVYGRKGTRVVTGGGTFVWGAVEAAQELDLGVMTIKVKADDVRTKDKLPVFLDWTAQIRIGQEEAQILTAAGSFLGQSQEVIKQKAEETLRGNVRAVIASLTPEQVHSDRASFISTVQQQVVDEMASMGLVLISLTIENLYDQGGYFDAQAAQELAKVKRDKLIAEAETQRETRESVAAANLSAKQAEIDAETKQADAQRDLDLKIASNLRDVNVAKAEANMAEKSRQAELENQLTVQEMAVQITREQELAKVAEKAAARKERELQTEVIRPAEAEAMKRELEATAIANSLRTQAGGQADAAVIAANAERDRLTAVAKGKQAELVAQAEGQKAGLLAQAEGQKASLLAEAEGKAKLAEALNAMNQASLSQTQALALIDALPQIAQAYAAAIGSIDNVKIVDMGGGGGGNGSLLGFVDAAPQAVFKMVESVKALTGVDLTQLLAGLVEGNTPEA